ncbi:MAG: D-tyrosyl-tRNA(Tyr) deacylase [Anaerolineae bacterium]|nr:D-tyrosyl-tRNA(Tyr) deacylase [Anaerolineae bacterium]NIN96516.1 D-tyrosyl-tRNA(Tyr) deacylase [Anaerolineae bacterium]NIQ79545.1 D-tyrosyl-tRNA(Tyr) deacylase [Anaerolineae bacterium]
MRAVVQRVSKASVSVEGRPVGSIGQGLVVLLGIAHDDGEEEARFLADKTANLRIFTDDEGKFNLSALEVGAEALVVSQFTLYGDARKGRRPSFTKAAPPDVAAPLVDKFVKFLEQEGLHVETGIFGAMMAVEIHNDGPVTIILER